MFGSVYRVTAQNTAQWHGMIRLLLGLSWTISASALAHPHSFIDMKTEIVSQDARLTGLKMSWTMDEITSSDVFYDAADAKPDSVTWKKLAAVVMAFCRAISRQNADKLHYAIPLSLAGHGQMRSPWPGSCNSPGN